VFVDNLHETILGLEADDRFLRSPFLNSSSVGIPRTMNLLGVIGFSSMSTFATVNLPLYSSAS
jgi:hypothetical protein